MGRGRKGKEGREGRESYCMHLQTPQKANATQLYCTATGSFVQPQTEVETTFTSCLRIKSLGCYGINLINEYNCRGILFGQSEHVPDHPRPLPQVLLDKF